MNTGSSWGFYGDRAYCDKRDEISYAIVSVGSRQLWIEEKCFYDLAKLPLQPGSIFQFSQILLVKKDNYRGIGSPFIDRYNIKATVLRHISGEKMRVYKMRPKKKTRKTFGFRPKLTRVYIQDFEASLVEQSTANLFVEDSIQSFFYPYNYPYNFGQI
jgi:large subunit ribosomal protein L21